MPFVTEVGSDEGIKCHNSVLTDLDTPGPSTEKPFEDQQKDTMRKLQGKGKHVTKSCSRRSSIASSENAPVMKDIMTAGFDI